MKIVHFIMPLTTKVIRKMRLRSISLAPGLNRQTREHPRARMERIAEVRKWLAQNGVTLPAPIQRYHLFAIRVSVALLDSADNLNATVKSLVDGMVHEGVLADDSPNNLIKSKVLQVKAKKRIHEGFHIWIIETSERREEIKDINDFLDPDLATSRKTIGRIGSIIGADMDGWNRQGNPKQISEGRSVGKMLDPYFGVEKRDTVASIPEPRRTRVELCMDNDLQNELYKRMVDRPVDSAAHEKSEAASAASRDTTRTAEKGSKGDGEEW